MSQLLHDTWTRLFPVVQLDDLRSRRSETSIRAWEWIESFEWQIHGRDSVTINGCVMEPLVEHWRTCLRDKGSFSREPRLTIHSTKASYEWKCFDSICATPEGCFRFRNSSTMFWRWTLQVLISLVKRKGQGIQWCFFSIFAFCARIPFR